MLTTLPRERTLLRNTHKARCFLWRQKNPEVKYSSTRISEEGVFVGEVSLSRKRDIFLGTWNLSSLFREGSFTAEDRELPRYKLDLVGVKEVRWDKGGTVRAGDYMFFNEREMKIISWEQDFLYNKE